ncbi:MAG: SH3 domain-containing protein [Rhodospirillaceae bacterium]|nr:SH3 domain-containing protein [Rhodospirillaceae bacterium]MBT6119258.1 SH3 domain-containing protein [Rhodospirillaceae bacterium]
MVQAPQSFEDAGYGLTRRSIGLALLLALVLIAQAASAVESDAIDKTESELAAEEAVPVLAPVKVRKLNIRSGPGTQYRILRGARRGEELAILEVDNGWARIDMVPPGWVLVRYIELPERFGLDPFVLSEDAFIDWAVETEFLEEISLQEEGVIWVALTPEGYVRTGRPMEIARRLACGYRERTGFEGKVTVTVWSMDGPTKPPVAVQGCDE